MLLTLTSTAPHATDLGYLLHKHPDRVQSFQQSFGTAVVYYPAASEERCTVALQVDVDPIALVRRRGSRGEQGSLAQYVNDRPYAAGSMLSVTIGRVFGTALAGRCDARPDLPDTPLPLTVRIPAVAARGRHEDARGAALVGRLFEPLGWSVTAAETPLAEGFDWGRSPYLDVTLTATLPLADALSHLYVLLPVLDDAKHYWISSDEVDKLVRRGEGWLAAHPERGFITQRYLGSRRRLIEDATARLNELDGELPEDAPVEADGDPEAAQPASPLRIQRLEAVLQALRDVGAHSVADVGCGEGFYLRALLADPSFTRILGVDVSARELEKAERRLHLDRKSDQQRARLTLRQSSVTYRDDALSGFDALLLVEVIEHLEPDRLPSLEATVFGAAKPRHVIVSTPNAEHNARYELAPGEFRHPDHRFEWTRSEFEQWARRVADAHGYAVGFRSVGEPDPELGPPTQLALFSSLDTSPAEASSVVARRNAGDTRDTEPAVAHLNTGDTRNSEKEDAR
ncbi:3' terminal RNA ribose 2'-O-methyltransferase Hen1 [Tessaracoccus massiliensis]|uniref:3' terminal RNA ribose 2'-O-methyltransferase Hen1 n=1 Tax=Tessaracoccus massiliensis TaxID=1522311 RepID=UPI000943B442|nr:3' terminal RNA ribose 2'-O-methyltransferase Hen1 [Tessaracoccus massiliensis]